MTKWPWNVLTNEGEARILLAAALERAPSLRADGLTGEGNPPELPLVAICNDFLLPVRFRKTIDDSETAAQRAYGLLPWVRSRGIEAPTMHGAFIAAALGRGAEFAVCGISCYVNLSSQDFFTRLQFLSRQISR